ncbi:MAG: ABC transporter permease [Candidatus Korobacteraceae bacterium]
MAPQHWLYTLPLRLRSLFRRRHVDDELDDELQYHLELKTQEYIDQGLSAEEAHYAALREFGNLELAKQNCRDTRRVLWFQNLLEDIRFGLRLLRKNPGFTAVAVLTLALGIGVNTAIFSVVNTVLLRPLPYAHPERLVFLGESSKDVPVMYISLANLADWRAMNTVFESMGAYRKGSVALTGHGEPQHLMLAQVTWHLFPTLGVAPILGHNLTAGEDQPDVDRVVLLSDTMWERQFRRDPEVLGKKLLLDGKSYTVTGVMPTSGLPLYWRQMDVFAPLGQLQKAFGGPDNRALHIGVSAYARLKPGVTVEQARQQMLEIARRLEKQYPQTNGGQSVVVQPLLEREVGQVSQPLRLLMGAVALVLLIACANVANLLTSRAIVRRREIAIRSAMGAGAARLAIQLLCESMLLALMGGGLGLLIAYTVTPVLAHRAISIVPRVEDISVDGTVLAFTFAVTLLTGVIFGVLPALAAYRTQPTEALEESARAGAGSGFWRMSSRNFLATAELAMALVLLVAAGLTLRSLFRVLQADLGMQTNNVLTGVLSLPEIPYKEDAQLAGFMQRLAPKLAALPGVTAAGFESAQLVGGSEASFRVEGSPNVAADQEPYSEFSSITPGALEAMGVKLLSGRFFGWSDDASSPGVCLVDDTLAAQYWPGQSPLGKRLSVDIPMTPDGKPAWQTVVGVVHRARMHGADEQHLAEIFIPYSQFQILRRGRLVVRSQQEPAALLAAVRGVVHSVDPELALYDVRSLAELVDENVAARRLETTLLSVFAGIALLLASLGVYGVMAYMVNGRTREIAVRRALGAKPWDILRLVLGQGMPVILAGAIIGIVASLWLRFPISSLLYGVSATDIPTILAVAGLLIVVALAACCIPLRRALGVDPAVVLRRE